MALSQLPSVSALTSDLWPSLSSALSTSSSELRRVRRDLTRNNRSDNKRISQAQTTSRTQLNVSHISLPECLQSVPLNRLRSNSPIPQSISTPSLWNITSTLTAKHLDKPRSIIMRQAGCRRDIWTSVGLHRIPSSASRYLPLVTSSPFLSRSIHCGPPSRAIGPRYEQKRLYGSSSQSAAQSVLAHAERTANNNPTSATAQAAFYSALLRANMPKIIIERYQAGRYASNAAADASYLKALQQIGSVPMPGSGGLINDTSNPGPGLSSYKLQAVGQAVAAQSRNGQVGSVTGKNTSGTGAKETPLYVVVDESTGATIFRWVRMLIYAALSGYIALVVLTLIVEMTGSLRTRSAQNNEVQPQHQTVRFSDIHGCDEAKDELQELVEFLLNPERFSSLGGKLPKGVLLVGPPGTGKTMLARAVAGEAGCPVFYMSGSEFDEMYVGVGAKRVRDLFAQARAKAPAIIFIDELDAVGGKRNERDPAYAKQTLNQLLTELDGFSPSTGVILIAATNYPQSLDKALTRPGRFDRRVQVPLPDVRGRTDILKHHMKKVAVAPEVDPTVLARGTSGFSGADLENLVNQAAVHASRKKMKKVGPLDFEWAKDKIMMGAESRSRMIREKDKVLTAYHEAGHALVNLLTPGSMQLHKMTIIPRGMALGVTHQLPEMDAVSRNYQQYIADIDMCMGGRAAEELVFGVDHVSSGISSDLSQATRLAYALVTQFGFSEKVGSLDLHSNYDSLSSQTKQEIEHEVRTIVEGARRRAYTIMQSKRQELELLKDALMEYETLSRDEILQIMNGEKLQRIEPEIQETQEERKDDDGPGRGGPPQPKQKKETGKKGGVGIKLPDVLLPPGTSTTRRDGEGT